MGFRRFLSVVLVSAFGFLRPRTRLSELLALPGVGAERLLS